MPEMTLLGWFHTILGSIGCVEWVLHLIQVSRYLIRCKLRKIIHFSDFAGGWIGPGYL